MTKPVDVLLAKEMSRKEFLATVGIGLTMVTGLSSLVNIFGGHKLREVSDGYGSSAYGGLSKMAKK